MFECKICNQNFENSKQLISHLKIHNIDYQTYLKTYVYKPFLYYNIQITPGTCPICGNSIKLIGFKLKKFCCHKCANEFMKSETFISEIDKKRRQTCIDLYSDENYRNSEKSKETKLERYGSENYNNRDLAKETCIKKYGVANIFKDTEYIKKCVNEKYGIDFVTQLESTKQKAKETNLKKYGADFYSQSETYKEVLPEIQKKIYRIKKKNNSFNTSAPEKKLLKILQNKFGASDIEYQYKSDLYPFVCDFYIKSLDLYIELQGSWIHGREPYNPENREHIKKLQEWQQKSQTSQFYRNAIDVWTVRDPLKRLTAKNNGIKLIEVFDSEFFSEIEFLIK